MVRVLRQPVVDVFERFGDSVPKSSYERKVKNHWILEPSPKKSKNYKSMGII